jgi:hypothetical protein
MKNLYPILGTLTLLFFSHRLISQVNFTDRTFELLEETPFYSGVALGIADVNNDGYDDLIRLDSATVLQVEFQKPNGGQFASFEHGQVTFVGEWAIVVGDINNDGYGDILTGGAYDNLKLYTFNAGTFNFIQTTLPNSSIFLQGSNFADINNDGFLDAFGCHDDGESRIWMNDGNGNLFNDLNVIDMKTTPISDNSGNYGSIWTDFDNDRDIDLYIAKCRLGVNDPTDPRRINALFENDGQNNYSENSEERGLKIGFQSWTSEFQDIDNDGDFDCFITNHDHQCQILENDGRGNFTDITSQTGLDINGDVLQGIMRDIDNDGFVDVITTRPDTAFYLNNGDKTFTPFNNSVSNSGLNSITCGDLNHDGFLDFYASYANNINQFSNKRDALFINEGNDNNFFAVELEGIQSNKKGVGARIEIHGDWGIQIREVRAGESYGISTTLTSHFGLGTHTNIDYVVVKWPSGMTDVISNPNINQFLKITEGTSCEIDDFDLELDGNLVLCEGDSLTISAPSGYTYLWQNGTRTQSITTSEPSNYSVVIVDSNGCVGFSNIVKVEYNPDETPEIKVEGELSFCEGEEVTLTSSTAFEYEWNTGETSQEITVTESGDYYVIVDGNCGEWESETITIEVFPNGVTPVTENDTIFSPGSAILTASGNNPVWFDSPLGGASIGSGNTFETPFIDGNTTFYVEDQLGYGGGDYSVGMEGHLGTNYNSINFNGETFFNLDRAIRLKTVTVYTDTYGVRQILLKDEFDQTIEAYMADIQSDTSIIELNFTIPAGQNYYLTTNAAINQNNIGTLSPRLKRSNENVSYPYVVDDVISITDSNGGPDFYYYFFDWQIEALPSTICPSERVSAEAILIVSDVKNHDELGSFSVYPNPSNGMINVDIKPKEVGLYSMVIIDVNGKKLVNKSIQLINNQTITKQLDLTDFPKGSYFINIERNGLIGSAKIIIE